MALIKLGKDPESPDGKSPTIYLDDEKDTYLVQGFKVADGERRCQIDLPAHEDGVEIPLRMVEFFGGQRRWRNRRLSSCCGAVTARPDRRQRGSR